MGTDALQSLAEGALSQDPAQQKTFSISPGNRQEDWDDMINMRLQADGPYQHWKKRGGSTLQKSVEGNILTLHGFVATVSGNQTDYLAIHTDSGHLYLWEKDASGDPSKIFDGTFNTNEQVSIRANGVFLYIFDVVNDIYKVYNIVKDSSYDWMSTLGGSIKSYSWITGDFTEKNVWGFEENEEVGVFHKYYEGSYEDTEAQRISYKSFRSPIEKVYANYLVYQDPAGDQRRSDEGPTSLFPATPGLEELVGKEGPYKNAEDKPVGIFEPIRNNSGNDETFVLEVDRIRVPEEGVLTAASTDTLEDIAIKIKNALNANDRVTKNYGISKSGTDPVVYVESKTKGQSRRFRRLSVDYLGKDVDGFHVRSTDTFSGVYPIKNDDFDRLSISRGYLILDLLSDGSYAMPGRPVHVRTLLETIQDNGKIGVKLELPTAADNVEKRLLFATRWQTKGENVFQPSRPEYPNSAFYLARQISAKETSYEDFTKDDKLTQPLNVDLPLAGGVYDFFGPDQLDPRAINSMEGALMLGGYTINRPAPDPYSDPENSSGGNCYVNIQSGDELMETSTPPTATITINGTPSGTGYLDVDYLGNLVRTNYDASNSDEDTLEEVVTKMQDKINNQSILTGATLRLISYNVVSSTEIEVTFEDIEGGDDNNGSTVTLGNDTSDPTTGDVNWSNGSVDMAGGTEENYEIGVVFEYPDGKRSDIRMSGQYLTDGEVTIDPGKTAKKASGTMELQGTPSGTNQIGVTYDGHTTEITYDASQSSEDELEEVLIKFRDALNNDNSASIDITSYNVVDSDTIEVTFKARQAGDDFNNTYIDPTTTNTDPVAWVIPNDDGRTASRQLELTGGEDGTPDVTISANQVQIHSLNTLVGKAYILAKEGSKDNYYLMEEVEIQDAELHGYRVVLTNIKSEIAAKDYYNEPAGNKIQETQDLFDNIVPAIPFQQVKISEQTRIENTARIKNIVPLQYDEDKTQMRYRLAVFTDDDLEMGYIVFNENGIDSKFEVPGQGLRLRHRFGAWKVEGVVIFQSLNGIHLLDGESFPVIIDKREYDIASKELQKVIYNSDWGEFWMLFSGPDNTILAYDPNEQSVRTFSYDNSLGEIRHGTYIDDVLVLGMGSDLMYSDLQAEPEDNGTPIIGEMVTKHLGTPNTQTKILEVNIAGQGYDCEPFMDQQKSRLEGDPDSWAKQFSEDFSPGKKSLEMARASYQFHKRSVMPRLKFKITGDSPGFVSLIDIKYIETRNTGKARST